MAHGPFGHAPAHTCGNPRADKDSHAIDAQGAAQKIGHPGRVQHVEVRAAEIEMHQRAVEAVADLLLQVLEIADGVAVLDAPCAADRAGR